MGFFFQEVTGDGVGNTSKQITEGVTDFASKVGEAFSNAFNERKISATIRDVDDQASKLLNTFGQGRDQIENLKSSLSDATIDVIRLGGNFQKVVDIQEDASNNLGRNVILASESYEKLFAIQKVLPAQSSYLIEGLKDVGVSLYQAASEVQHIMDRSRELGVNAQKVGAEVAANLGLLNKFTFQGGVDGLAKMAAQAINMRVHINAVSGTLEKAFNPESAIQMAASLQSLGVAQSDLLDPLRLMDLAQNDPAELQNQIVQMSKQFVQLNEKGQFEIMPGAKRQMKEIADAMGMSQDNLAKMALSSAELGDKMSKIRFSGNFSEEEKTMIANMSEMGDGGEYKISMTTSKGKETLSIEDAMMEIERMGKEERAKFFESQQPKDISELAKDQLSVSETMSATLLSIEKKLPMAIAATKGAGKLYSGLKSGFEGFGDVMDNEMLKSKKIRVELDKATDGLMEAFKDGNIDFGKLSTAVSGFADYVNGAFKATFKEAEQKFNGVLSLGKQKDKPNVDDKSMSEKQSSHVQKLSGNDVIKMPGKEVQLLPEDSVFAMTKGPEFLEKLSMLNQPMKNSGTGTVNENKNTHDITLSIKIDGGNLSENKVMEVLNKTETLRALNQKLKETITNNGLTV